MRYLKQSTAAQVRTIGPFVDDTDFKTAATGLTIANTDVRIKKNGANDVAKNSGGATHDVNGCYHLTFDATDTDTVGEFFYSVKVAGALQVFGAFTVLEEAVYDMLFGASAIGYVANQPVDLNTIKTQTVTAGAGVTILASVGTAATSTAQTGDSFAIVNSGTHGNAALKTLIDTVDNILDTEFPALVTTIGVAGAGLTAAGGDGSQLTAINLPNQTMDIVGNITGNLSGSVGSVTGAVGSVTGAVGSVTGLTAADVAAIKVITDALGATAAALLAKSAGTMVVGTVDDTVSPTTTEFEAADITEATADHYNGRVIIFTSGALVNQATSISDYSLAGGKGHFTVVALTEAPADTDTFIIV